MLCGTGGLERTQSTVQTPLVDDSWPHQVCEGLYVGSAQASTNLQRLQQYGIGHVVNAATATEGCHFRPDGIIYHCVDVLDGVNESISHVFALTSFRTGAVCLCIVIAASHEQPPYAWRT